MLKKLSKITNELKIMAFEMLNKKGGGHYGGSFSCAEILSSLFFKVMKKNDKFILSKAHASVILYAVLFKKKKISLKTLKSYGEENSSLGVHGETELLKDIEFSCGSLGHGLSYSCGLALGFKKKGLNRKVFCLIGDGEMQEGSIWEALLFASQHQLDNLTVIVDYNKKQSSGKLNEIISLSPLDKKIKSFNFDLQITNGHNLKNLITSFNNLKKNNKKPKFLIANTIKGKGIKFLEEKNDCHYDSLPKKVIEKARFK